MAKYQIKREFFPFSHFTPPISEKFLAMAVMHGFDIVQKAATTKAALAARIEFMKKILEKGK